MNTDKEQSYLEGDRAKIYLCRLGLAIVVVFYAFSIGVGQEFYLSFRHSFWGFARPSYDFAKILFMLYLVIVPVTVLPLSLNRVSSVFLYSAFFFVYVPSVVIGLLNSIDSTVRYFLLLNATCIGLMVSCILPRVFDKKVSSSLLEPSAFLALVNVACALVCIVVLFLTYGSILSFSGFIDVYGQREKGAATSLFIGYCQVYLAYVFAPLLFCYGLVFRQWGCFSVAIVSFVFVFMITAERTVLLMPGVLLLLCLTFKNAGLGISNIYRLFFYGGAAILIIALSFDSSLLVNQVGTYFFMRLVAIPGLLVTQYYDFFSSQGYTYWSHVTGVSSFVDIPPVYASDPKWPALGKILAERVLGVQSQSNASFIATDGVAAAGAVGVLVICLAYACWLCLLDWAARGWEKLFLLPAIFPMAFVSTNGSLFTMLASFGGFYWILILTLGRYRFDSDVGRGAPSD